MTAHASKGLGYDDVIVLNGQNAKYGFPAKIEDDPVLGFVVHEDRSMAYAEERRLFYVAMTRTKNRVDNDPRILRTLCRRCAGSHCSGDSG